MSTKTSMDDCRRSILGFITSSLIMQMVLGRFECYLDSWEGHMLAQSMPKCLEVALRCGRFAPKFQAWLCSPEWCFHWAYGLSFNSSEQDLPETNELQFQNLVMSHWEGHSHTRLLLSTFALSCSSPSSTPRHQWMIAAGQLWDSSSLHWSCRWFLVDLNAIWRVERVICLCRACQSVLK